MKMARLAASVFALAIFALPAAAQQDGSSASTKPAAAAQTGGDMQQALKGFLSDTRPVNQLTVPELRIRLKAGRDLVQSHSLDPASLRQVRMAMQELRTELQSRQNGTAANTVPGQQPSGQNKSASGAGAGASDQGTAGKPASAGQTQKGTAAGTPSATPTQPGTAANGQPAAGTMTLDELLSDSRPASALSPAELRQRFATARGLMANPSLKPDQKQALQKMAREARLELGLRAKGAGGQPPAGTAPGSDNSQTTAGAAAQSPKNADNTPPGSQTQVDATTILYDNRPLNTLTVDELRNRVVSIRHLFQTGAVLKNQKSQLAGMMRAARNELIARGAKPGGGAGQSGGGQNQNGQMQGGAGQGMGQSGGLSQPVPNAQAETAARKFLADQARAEQMPNGDLRVRLQGMRDLLQANQLTPETRRALVQKLAADRTVLRGRMGGGMGGGGNGQQPGGGKIAPGTQVSINVVLADRRPPNQLNEWELRRRIDVLRDALLNQQIDSARRVEWQTMIERDRQFMHQQLMARRQARMQELNRERQDNQININLGMQFDPGRRPPPPSVFAAEADDQQLADTLSAPPRRAISRRYTIQEVENSPDLRDALPRVEIDTIHFGFGESFVREEEVGNLDHVAAVLEKILTAHPREVFIIEGHTDAVGSPDANLELSRKRAEAVKQALTDYYVIPPENLQTVGYGERFLKIPTPDPEPENRRVSIVRATPLVGELGQ